MVQANPEKTAMPQAIDTIQARGESLRTHPFFQGKHPEPGVTGYSLPCGFMLGLSSLI